MFGCTIDPADRQSELVADPDESVRVYHQSMIFIPRKFPFVVLGQYTPLSLLLNILIACTFVAHAFCRYNP